jgi:Arc/MetJ-type ribon-helix-helix transcriptional regulator
MRDRFRTIKLPEAMVKHIELMVTLHPEWGYRSTADFVKDSVRQNFHSLDGRNQSEETR